MYLLLLKDVTPQAKTRGETSASGGSLNRTLTMRISFAIEKANLISGWERFSGRRARYSAQFRPLNLRCFLYLLYNVCSIMQLTVSQIEQSAALAHTPSRRPSGGRPSIRESPYLLPYIRLEALNSSQIRENSPRKHAKYLFKPRKTALFD